MGIQGPDAGYGAGPIVAGIAFIASMTSAIWWESRSTSYGPAIGPPRVASKPAPARPAPVVPAPVPAQVVALARFAEKDLPEQSPDARGAAAEGMRVLAEAIAARGDSILWRDRAKRLTEAAAKVEGAGSAEQAADAAHEALLQAAEWIGGLRLPDGAGSPDAALAAAKSIEGGRPLGEQSARVEQFFDAAASALGGTSI
jgi:hypothetical protein